MAQNKKWRESNKNRVQYLQDRWKKDNADYYLEYGKKYRKDNAEIINIRVSEWKKNNPDRIRQYNRKRREVNNTDIFTKEDEKIVLATFNYKCCKCNTTEDLQIDHHRPLSKGHALCIGNAVILCGICNRVKFTKDPEDFYNFYQLEQLEILLKL